MNSIEISRPIVINSREINTFVIEDRALAILGVRDVRLARDFFLKNLDLSAMPRPRNDQGDTLSEPYFKTREDFYYTFHMNIKSGHFTVFAKISIEPVRVKNREMPGAVFHVMEVILTLDGGF